jgi:hypothetical protein
MLFEYLFRNISMFGWSDPDPDPDRAPRLAHLLIHTQLTHATMHAIRNSAMSITWF